MKKFLLLFLIVFCSCSNPEKPVYDLPVNAFALISADSAKTWKLAQRYNDKIRMNMGVCFLAYRQTFAADSTMNDNAGETRECGETLLARWKFAEDKKGNSYIKLNSEQLPELLQMEKNYKYFKILQLSENELVLQYTHKQFSNKTRIITDYYVPENVAVEDRDFHW